MFYKKSLNFDHQMMFLNLSLCSIQSIIPHFFQRWQTLCPVKWSNVSQLNQFSLVSKFQYLGVEIIFLSKSFLNPLELSFQMMMMLTFMRCPWQNGTSKLIIYVTFHMYRWNKKNFKKFILKKKYSKLFYRSIPVLILCV